MKISYEITIDDIVAFNRYHFEHSRVFATQKFMRVFIMPAIMFLSAASLAYGMEEPAFLVGGALVALLLGFLMHRDIPKTLERNVRKMYAEGSNKGTLGPHELEISGDRLIHRSPFVETKYRFEIIERLAATADHTFIYVNAVTAHVIPHGSISSGDHEAILDAIRRRLPDVTNRAANSLLVE